jgi:hypothetical protein
MRNKQNDFGRKCFHEEDFILEMSGEKLAESFGVMGKNILNMK